MSDLLTEDEVAKVTGSPRSSLQCEVLANHGVFFVKDRNGCPHVTWYCYNHPAHLRSKNEDKYTDEPDFEAMG